MYDLIARPLQFFYELWPNYGAAIALLTLAIMLLLLPLTLKGTRSMLAMQKLQPELKKLQAKHRDDRQKLNEEVMKFYKENNINPLSGCMPLLLQMPVFFILYRTLYDLINRRPFGFDLGASVGRSLNGVDPGYWDKFGFFHPKHIEQSSRLYQDLSHTNEMRSFGLDLAISAQRALTHNFTTALPYLVMVLAVAGTSYYQQRQIAGRNPAAATANPQQAMLMKIMPVFFAFISLTLPAGIVVYFLVSNLFRVGQQGLITRTMYRDEAGAIATTGKDSDKSSSKSGPKTLRDQFRELEMPNPRKAREDVRAASGKPSDDANKPARTKAVTQGGSASRSTAAPSRTAPVQPNRSKSKKKRK